jgi:hypothetical protein
VALTVGKDLCTLSIRGKCEENAACGSKADGWGERACAAALTVGKDLLHTFPSVEKYGENIVSLHHQNLLQ